MTDADANHDGPNAEQAGFWSTGSGLDWVDREADLDAAFAPVNNLIAAALPRAARRLLDIGCGTGATARHMLTREPQSGVTVHATDISDTLLAQAKASAAGLKGLSFALADGQTADLGGPFDAVYSRFGVMFFSDPTAAFANIRRAVSPGGTLAIACWGPFKENPWFTVPRFAATDRLGAPPPFDPRAPGPFAFSDADYTLGILQRAGWSDPQVTPADVTLSPRGGPVDLADLVTQIGPAKVVIRERGGTADDAAAIEAEVARRFAAAYPDMSIPARLYLYTARA
ncbi:MAG: class I SAM-dependent methyltransferase [Pseudomonadota bacterium]